MSETPGSSALTPTGIDSSARPMDHGPTRCHATVRRTGKQCRKFPIRGATVCGSHGGMAPQVRHRAAQNVLVADSAALVARRGYEPVADPVEALLSVAGEMVALKDALADQVAKLTDITVTDRTGAQNIAATLGAYERLLSQVAKTLTAINRLGIQNRRVNIEAVQAGLLAEALQRAVFSPRAKLPYDQAQLILRLASDEFTLLTA